MELKLIEEMYKRNQASEMSSKPKEEEFSKSKSGQYFRDSNKLIDVIIFNK